MQTHSLPLAFHQISDTVLPGHGQAALLLDLARTQEIALSEQRVLSLAAAQQTAIAPETYLQALRSFFSQRPERDSSFLLGQQLLPGHYGHLSQALIHAPNLRDALRHICAHYQTLCPLLRPRLIESERFLILYWCDSYGVPALRNQLVEMHMSAVVALARWLAESRFQWRFCFNRPPPRTAEQHQTFLGHDLQFSCQLDAMVISREQAERPWPRASQIAWQLAQQQSPPPACNPSLLNQLYDYLQSRLRQQPVLEQTAQDFGLSPATLKRYLSKHGSHFQAELDFCRTHMALYLLTVQGMDTEQVANWLGFHDANNFRRSCKRWTGVSPSSLRADILARLNQPGWLS